MLAAVARAEEKKDSDQPQKSPAAKAAKTAKAPRSSQTVALLDVNALFKGDDDFKRQTAMMKIDADAAEAKLRQEAESIKAAAEEAQQADRGKPRTYQAPGRVVQTSGHLAGSRADPEAGFRPARGQDLQQRLPSHQRGGGEVC